MIKTKLKNRNLSQEDVFNFSELFKLMKPRVMSLVIFTCAVGLLMAPNVISTKDAIIGIILVSIGAGAAGALNMWYESDLDALMTRTCLRPIREDRTSSTSSIRSHQSRQVHCEPRQAIITGDPNAIRSSGSNGRG